MLALALLALAASAQAQTVAGPTFPGQPVCVSLCALAKVREGYCNVATFAEAYATCLTQNCQSDSDLAAGRALTEAQICATAQSLGATPTATITGAAATPTGTAGNAISSGAAVATMSGPASGASSAAMPSMSANASGGAAAYVTGLQAALTGAGLTTLAGLVPAIAQNMTLATALTTGNKTVFGPSDAAFAAAGASSLPAAQLQNILTYHIANGTFNASNVPMAPNVTFIRSLLNTAPAVLLPGNAGQVIKLQRTANGSLAIGSNGTMVTGNATYMNLQLYVIPSLLSVPGNLSTVLASNSNYSTLASLVTPQIAAALSSIRGVTLFAPTNAAFQKVASALPQLQGNQTLLMNVLLNHVLNGTVAYSPTIASGNTTVTSASGQPLVISRSATGITVNVGSNVTANVVSPDNILANGVLHGIDNVLVNTASDPNAAAAAASSAAAAGPAQATQGTGNGGTVGGSSGNTGAGGSGGSGGNSGASVLFASSAVLALVVAAGLAVIA